MGKVHKGWVNSRTGKMNMWQSNLPYHIGHVASNPQKYGYTRDELIDVLGNSKVTTFVRGDVPAYFASLVSGSRDANFDIEQHMFDDGWIRVTMEETTWRGMGLADIMGTTLREIHKGLKIMEGKGYALDVLLGDAIITLWTGRDRGSLNPELRIEDKQSWREFMKTGRPPREKRTEIGRTMAMFRESVGSEAEFRAHWKKAPSSYDYKMSTIQGQNEYWNAYFKHFEHKYGELPIRIKKAIREAGFKSNPTITHKGEKFSMRTGMDQFDLLYHVYSTMNEDKLQEKTYAKSGIGAWMNQQSAGGGPGWDRYSTTGTKLGKCGDAEEGEPYSACLSRQKADKLGKKGIASFVRRKREAQKEAGRGDIGDGEKGKKPVYVKTGITDKDPKKKGIQDAMMSFKRFLELKESENKPTNPSLWKKATDLAKKTFNVYPSVYANAWASKWYKEQGGTWRKVSES